ncbi:hypothetical protein PM082_018662 [Marasmius tenuissimus]|nr:hypothetical protein PM082_018662 [Marasmius tenuissimus]
MEPAKVNRKEEKKKKRWTVTLPLKKKVGREGKGEEQLMQDHHNLEAGGDAGTSFRLLGPPLV